MEVREIKRPYKIKTEDQEIRNFQHIKILDCNKPVSRVIFECWHCKQGLLSEVEGISPQIVEIECPTCGKAAIRLTVQKVLSKTAIPSPWGK
jgi:Zn finger protein HypA/HybF involved in hydrogenase expression